MATTQIDFKVKNGLIVGTTATIQSTVPSSSTATGALKVVGGVGIGGGVFVGGITTATSFSAGGGSNDVKITSSGVSRNGGTVYLTGGTNSAPSITAGAGVSAGNNGPLDLYGGSGASGAAGYINLRTAANFATIVTSNSATVSTITGALQVVGGLGIGGSVFVGGTVTANAFVGNLTGTTTNASNILTTAQQANASYYPTFVDTNNTVATFEALYTTSSFSINPSTQAVTFGGSLAIGSSSTINGSRILVAGDLATVTYPPYFITNDPNSVVGLATIANTTTIYGTYNTGTIASILTASDYTSPGGYWSINDAATQPGHVEYVGFQNVASFTRLVVNLQYTQSSGHTIDIDLYNYVTSSWDTFAVYSGTTNYFQFILQTDTPTNYISSGRVTARLYHVSFGNPTHETRIDYVALQDSIQGGQGPRGATGATGATGPQGLTTSTTSSFHIYSTSATNSTQTGALIVDGGVGVGGSLFLGGTVTAQGGTASYTQAIGQSLVASNGVGVTGDSYFSANVGIGGAAYILGDLYVDGTQFVVNSQNISTGDKTITLSTGSTSTILATGSGLQVGSTATPYISFLYDGVSNWVVNGTTGTVTGIKTPVINNIYITTASTSATLTLANGVVLNHPASLTFPSVNTTTATWVLAMSGTANTLQFQPPSTGPQGFQGVQGAQGFQGVQGAQGFQGVQGAQGFQGVQGAQGFQGVQGTQGFQGVQGASGGVGSQGSQGFQGVQGAQGFQGVQGAQGFQGVQGAQGFQGVQGSVGAQGAQGAQGFQGVQGAQGFQGVQGAQGFQGVQGSVGAQGAQGSTGNKGGVRYYFDQASTLAGTAGNGGLRFNNASTASVTSIYAGVTDVNGTNFGSWLASFNSSTNTIKGQLYVTNNASTSPVQTVWNVTASTNNTTYYTLAVTYLSGTAPTNLDPLVLEFAPAGNLGAQGTQGVQGVQGAQGFQGVQGSSGVGTQGVQGAQGAQGFQGVQGAQGFQGVQGAQGFQGVQGAQGFQGFQGVQGAQGVQGTQGVQGVQGPQGFQGFQGVQGSQGAGGPQGVQGSQGSSAGTAGNVTVSSTLTNASFYPVFVSVNTSTPTALTEYTTSSFSINPNTGVITNSSTAASTSTTTGALIVTGGVGVGGNINLTGPYLRLGLGPTDNPPINVTFKSALTSTAVLALWNSNVGGYSTISYFDTAGTEQAASGYAQTGTTYYSGLAYYYSNNGLALSGSGLGTTGNRDIFINTSGAVLISRTISVSSTNTGALQVGGGVGVGGGGYFGGTVTATNFILNGYQVSTSTSGGSAGGVTVSSTLTNASFYPVFVSVNTSTPTALPEYTTSTFSINPSTGVTIHSSNVSATSTNTGALQVVGGVGVGGSLYIGGNITASTVGSTFALGIAAPSQTGLSSIAHFSGGNIKIDANKSFLWDGTFPTTILGSSGVSGYIEFNAGNAGTPLRIDYGGLTKVQSTTQANSTNTGALQVTGGVGIGGNLYVGNSATILSTLASTASVQNNALYVAGGIGIGSSLYVTGPAVFNNSVTFAGTTTYVLSTNTVYTDNIIELHYPSTGTVWTVNDGKDIGLRFHYYNAGDQNAGLVLANDTKYLEWYGTGSEDSTSTIKGSYGTFKTGGIVLTNTTASVSTTTGALQVTGGVGIGGSLYVGGAVYSNGSQILNTSIQEFTATAGQTTFTIAGGYVAGQIQVFANGIQLNSGDYTASNGTTVVVNDARRASDVIRVVAGQNNTVSLQQAYTFNQYTSVGTTTTFATTYNTATVQVYQNGTLQMPTTYTASNGSSIVFGSIPSTGTVIGVISFNSVSIANAISSSGGTVNGTLNVVGTLQVNGNNMQNYATAMAIAMGV